MSSLVGFLLKMLSTFAVLPITKKYFVVYSTHKLSKGKIYLIRNVSIMVLPSVNGLPLN